MQPQTLSRKISLSNSKEGALWTSEIRQKASASPSSPAANQARQNIPFKAQPACGRPSPKQSSHAANQAGPSKQSPSTGDQAHQSRAHPQPTKPLASK